MPSREQPSRAADEVGRAEVLVYTLSFCGYCAKAKRLLRRREIAFTEINGDDVPGFRDMLRERTGARTVPQIVIDGEPIGGATELAELDRRGVLMPRVERRSFPVAVALPAPRRWLDPLRRLRGRSADAPSPAVLVDRNGLPVSHQYSS